MHIYNNLYSIAANTGFQYAWGVGVQSSIYAEENLFQVADGVTADSLLGRFNGTSLHEHGNIFDSPSDTFVADLVGAYNATHDPDLVESVSWTPVFHTDIDLARRLKRIVPGLVGPRNW